MVLIFKIKNNQLIFETESMRNFYTKFLIRFNNTNRKLTMDLDEYSPITTDAQISLFKKILLECVKISGHSYSELEQEMIDTFSPFNYQKDFAGKVFKRRKKIQEMNNNEFQIFITQSLIYMQNVFELDFEL